MALAAALVLACAMATAMAVSPELRATIISMFRLDEAEQVPDISAKVNEVRQITIGETVSANYVKVDGIWSWSTDGALLCNGTWAGDGSSFYKLDGRGTDRNRRGRPGGFSPDQLEWPGLYCHVPLVCV